MRAGMVVSIRVNPRDCQSVLDVMKLVGMKVDGHSFSHMVSLTLSALLETQREAGNIPEPDEFQYLNRMQQFMTGRNGKKLAVARAIAGAGAKVRMPALPKFAAADPLEMPADEGEAESSPETFTTVDAVELKMAGKEMTELLAKRDAAEDNPGISWSESDKDRLRELHRLIYQEEVEV